MQNHSLKFKSAFNLAEIQRGNENTKEVQIKINRKAISEMVRK